MKESHLTLKIVLTCIIGVASPFAAIFLPILLSFGGFWEVTIVASLFLLPLAIPAIWLEKRKPYLIVYGSYLLCFAILFGTQAGMMAYQDAITIDVTPNINVREYLPFDENSKIVKMRSEVLA